MEQNLQKAPFFMTHHSPVGSWSSFTFGLPGKGVSIDLESPCVKNNADFLVGMTDFETVSAFPFVEGVAELDNELRQVSHMTKNEGNKVYDYISMEDIERNLSFCIDEYNTKCTDTKLSLRAYTPNYRLNDPECGEIDKTTVCPGILLELTVDNTKNDKPVMGFMGIRNKCVGKVISLDWMDSALAGIEFNGKWAIASYAHENDIFTIRGPMIAPKIKAGEPFIHNGGNEGCITLHVAAGEKKTLTAAFGFYLGGIVTQGLETKYLYTRYFRNVEEVCRHLLDNADAIKASCAESDRQIKCPDADRRLYIYQAIRSYFASTQLQDKDGEVLYHVCEGGYLWRNTMDLASEHIFFEIQHNPWVTRNFIDQFIDMYSYHDDVYFGDDDGPHPGGFSFAHDMGCFTAYSPKGYSGYEKTSMDFYCYMTTEELFNGIYCIASYLLKTKDIKWAEKRADVLKELLDSIENREGYCEEMRDGLIKGKSSRCGKGFREITTYDALGPTLATVVGNPYVASKTLCSEILMKKVYELCGETEYAEKAAKMIARTTKSLIGMCGKGCAEEVKIMAIAEPFAVLGFCGLADELDKDLLAALAAYLDTCLVKGKCLEENYGGLRLSSKCNNTWVSKVVLCVYVMENIFHINVKEKYPEVLRELGIWMQIAAAYATISDQVLGNERRVIGGNYYPRIASVMIWN